MWVDRLTANGRVSTRPERFHDPLPTRQLLETMSGAYTWDLRYITPRERSSDRWGTRIVKKGTLAMSMEVKGPIGAPEMSDRDRRDAEYAPCGGCQGPRR